MSEEKQSPHGGYRCPIPEAEFERLREKLKRLPHVVVSEQRFIDMMIKEGIELDKATSAARIARQMGAYTQIGDQMVGIEEAKERFVL